MRYALAFVPLKHACQPAVFAIAPDRKTRSAPSTFVVTLARPTHVMLFARSDQTDGLNFRVFDQLGLELEAGHFYGHSPRQLMLPQGGCRMALLDGSGLLLSEQTVTIGTRPMTVVLTR